MSRIGLTLGGRPAHLNQLDHTRRIPWAVQQVMDDERREKESLPFLHKPDVSSEENEGRPPPCVGICYYQKLQALQEREKLLNHNDVLKEGCDDADCIDYKAHPDHLPHTNNHDNRHHDDDDEEDEDEEEEEAAEDEDEEDENNVLDL